MDQKTEVILEKKKRGPKPKAKPLIASTEIVVETTNHVDTSPLESVIETLMAKGIPCEYMKFQSPVPAAIGMEPVYELKLESKDSKYKVDQISHNGNTVYWRKNGFIQFAPWVNVQHARPLVET